MVTIPKKVHFHSVSSSEEMLYDRHERVSVRKIIVLLQQYAHQLFPHNGDQQPIFLLWLSNFTRDLAKELLLLSQTIVEVLDQVKHVHSQLDKKLNRSVGNSKNSAPIWKNKNGYLIATQHTTTVLHFPCWQTACPNKCSQGGEHSHYCWSKALSSENHSRWNGGDPDPSAEKLMQE